MNIKKHIVEIILLILLLVIFFLFGSSPNISNTITIHTSESSLESSSIDQSSPEVNQSEEVVEEELESKVSGLLDSNFEVITGNVYGGKDTIIPEQGNKKKPVNNPPETMPEHMLLPFEVPSISYNESTNISIHVFKSRRELEIWENDEIIAVYSIALGFDPIGDKQIEGDGKTPEGTYYVCTKNSTSKFYLSLGLSYPNQKDALRGYEQKLISKNQKNQIDQSIANKEQPSWYTPLGGEIMIHGYGSKTDWTAGCIAVENQVMDILWLYCQKETSVTIYP